MSYDPKEVEKWRKVCGSKNPLDYLRKLHEDGKLNRGDIPLI
jgi:chromatin segregation and condensation protein Rec8/ScpA/Scc1 (kleisin family)